MKSEIIGNPAVFAIEFCVESIRNETVYGFCKLWLQNQFLGDIDDPIYLTGFLPSLHGLAYYFNRYELVDNIPLVPASPAEFVKMWNENENLTSNYILAGAGFDKFYKLCFRNRDKLMFYWCLDPDIANSPEDFPQYINCSKGVHVAEVPVSEIKDVADKFKAKIQQLVIDSKN